MTTAEKLVKIAENEQKVYEAGQKSMVDESKIIEKTVSGSVIVVDDVSEVPHEVSVQLSSDTVTDFSGVNVRVSSRNLIKYPYINTTLTTNGITFTDNGDTSITISGKATADATFMLFTLDVGTSNMWNESVNNNGYFVSGCKHFFYNGSNKIHSIAVPSGTDYSANPITVKPQLYKGNSIADAVTIYKPNADGTLTIKSASPNMYITAETDGINISATYHKSWGMQTEYDRFWDEFQQNGNRADYNTAFRGVGWTADTFKPKYDIIPVGNTNSMFVVSEINADLVEILEKQGIVLDFSKVTMLGSGFQNSKFTRIGEINCSSFTATGTTALFHNCTALKVIDKIIVNENITFQSWFGSCSALEEIRFDGAIGQSLDLHWSRKLSAESYYNIILHLSSTATGVKLTVPTNAPAVYDAKYGSGAWKRDTDDNINIKGWSFAYA